MKTVDSKRMKKKKLRRVLQEDGAKSLAVVSARAKSGNTELWECKGGIKE